MNTTTAPCSRCHVNTTHNVLYSIKKKDDEYDDIYEVLQCAGCGTISFMNRCPELPEQAQSIIKYYPSPISRRVPEWAMFFTLGIGIYKDDQILGQLLKEIYEAVRGEQYMLAAMGIRSLIEQMMISKVDDHGRFDKNLEEFAAKGYISLIQRDALIDILEVEHGVTHRAFKPSEEDSNVALDIVEGVFAAIYVHGDASKKAADRVPPRMSKPRKTTNKE